MRSRKSCCSKNCPAALALCPVLCAQWSFAVRTWPYQQEWSSRSRMTEGNGRVAPKAVRVPIVP